MFRQLVLMGSAAGSLIPIAALAHHSPAAYDLTREVLIEGTVAKLDWKNPHILMTVETRSSGDEAVFLEIEVASVSQVRVLGLPREAIAPGEHVVVRAAPARRGPAVRALGLTVRTDDGTVHPLTSVHPEYAVRPSVAVQARGLPGRWVPTVESFNVFAVAQSWPFTETGHAVHAETKASVLSGRAPNGFCQPFPALNLAVIPDPITVEVREQTVLLSFEAEGMNQQRIVHLDQAQHPTDLVPSLMGHSIGRWEGETLVIDTVAIEPHPRGNLALPSTPRTHWFERLTLADDRRQLVYTFTLEDPSYLTGPASFTARWDYRPDLEPSLEVCDPDNARRALVE
jgi:hypothetical protein